MVIIMREALLVVSAKGLSRPLRYFWCGRKAFLANPPTHPVKVTSVVQRKKN